MIYHQIMKIEKDVYYKMAFNRLREKGYVFMASALLNIFGGAFE